MANIALVYLLVQTFEKAGSSKYVALLDGEATPHGSAGLGAILVLQCVLGDPYAQRVAIHGAVGEFL
ncbi:MAG: hypothetical protein ABSB41_16435 [Anaerolineales bacterium]